MDQFSLPKLKGNKNAQKEKMLDLGEFFEVLHNKLKEATIIYESKKKISRLNFFVYFFFFQRTCTNLSTILCKLLSRR